MRAVVDTNILIRAVIKPQGSVRGVLDRLDTQDYTLLYSGELVDELTGLLARPRLRRRYPIIGPAAFLALL